MAALPMIAQGATVTVTLTGHVLTATDGYGNLFTTTGEPTPLDNLPFTLVFTFDDSLATPFIPPPCGGAPYYSQSSGTDMFSDRHTHNRWQAVHGRRRRPGRDFRFLVRFAICCRPLLRICCRRCQLQRLGLLQFAWVPGGQQHSRFSTGRRQRVSGIRQRLRQQLRMVVTTCSKNETRVRNGHSVSTSHTATVR